MAVPGEAEAGLAVERAGGQVSDRTPRALQRLEGGLAVGALRLLQAGGELSHGEPARLAVDLHLGPQRAGQRRVLAVPGVVAVGRQLLHQPLGPGVQLAPRQIAFPAQQERHRAELGALRQRPPALVREPGGEGRQRGAERLERRPQRVDPPDPLHRLGICRVLGAQALGEGERLIQPLFGGLCVEQHGADLGVRRRLVQRADALSYAGYVALQVGDEVPELGRRAAAGEDRLQIPRIRYRHAAHCTARGPLPGIRPAPRGRLRSHMPHTSIATGCERRRRWNTFSSQLRFSRRSITTRCPASAAQRST